LFVATIKWRTFSQKDYLNQPSIIDLAFIKALTLFQKSQSAEQAIKVAKIHPGI